MQGVAASVRAEKARFAPIYTRCNVVAVAVWLFVAVGTVQGALDRLLEEGDYRRSVKERRSIKGAFSVAWWLLVTAIFLLLILTPLGDRIKDVRSYA